MKAWAHPTAAFVASPTPSAGPGSPLLPPLSAPSTCGVLPCGSAHKTCPGTAVQTRHVLKRRHPCISAAIGTKYYPDTGWLRQSFIFPLISQPWGGSLEWPPTGAGAAVNLGTAAAVHSASCRRAAQRWGNGCCPMDTRLVWTWPPQGPRQGAGAGPRWPPTATMMSAGPRGSLTSAPRCLLLVVPLSWERSWEQAAPEKHLLAAMAGQSLGSPGPAHSSPRADTALHLRDGGKKYLVR